MFTLLAENICDNLLIIFNGMLAQEIHQQNLLLIFMKSEPEKVNIKRVFLKTQILFLDY